MPRSQAPRKKRRATLDARVDCVDLAIARVSTLRQRQRADLGDPLRHSLDAMRTGRGSAAHWANLADGLNVAEALAQAGIGGDEVEQRVAHGQAALATLHARQATRGSWTLRPDELVALDEAVFWAGWQMDHCSQGEMVDAIGSVQRRVAGAIAGAAPAGAIVCGLLGRPDAAAS